LLANGRFERPSIPSFLAAYIMLRGGVPYRPLGHDDFDHLDKSKTTTRLVRRLRGLGYEVELETAA
jgi:hypothetical protein